MAPTSGKRLKNISISVPFLYGNSATPLPDPKPPNTPPDHTHSWTVFVKSVNGMDMTPFIKKVVFKLHDTYNNSSRSIESPPYEVTETGWGEFEIGVRIYFINDANEKNVSLYHHLKLHPFGNYTSKDNLIESVAYDEIIFQEPTEAMFEKLTLKPMNYLPYERSDAIQFTRQTELEEIDRYSAALATVTEQIEKQKEKLEELEREHVTLTAAEE